MENLSLELIYFFVFNESKYSMLLIKQASFKQNIYQSYRNYKNNPHEFILRSKPLRVTISKMNFRRGAIPAET